MAFLITGSPQAFHWELGFTFFPWELGMLIYFFWELGKGIYFSWELGTSIYFHWELGSYFFFTESSIYRLEI